MRDLGQNLWLDQISHPLLRSGTLRRCTHGFSITGLMSNPTIFDQALASGAYDDSIRLFNAAGLDGEAQFFELALEELTEAARQLRPTFRSP